MPYTVNGKVYRNLEEQVLKNKEDIEELQQGGTVDIVTSIDDSSTDEQVPSAKCVYEDVLLYAEAIADDVTDMQPKVDRALLTPISTPTEKELVGVDTGNSQMMVKIGSGLELAGGTSPYTLNATGGGGEYTAGPGIEISGVGEISVKVDGTTIDVNGNGELEAIGGGGGAYEFHSATATASSGAWIGTAYPNLTVTGMTANPIAVWVSPAPSSYVDYITSQIRAVSTNVNTVVLNCTTKPTSDVNINIVWVTQVL